jgi:hypothetical protein
MTRDNKNFVISFHFQEKKELQFTESCGSKATDITSLGELSPIYGIAPIFASHTDQYENEYSLVPEKPAANKAAKRQHLPSVRSETSHYLNPTRMPVTVSGNVGGRYASNLMYGLLGKYEDALYDEPEQAGYLRPDWRVSAVHSAGADHQQNNDYEEIHDYANAKTNGDIDSSTRLMHEDDDDDAVHYVRELVFDTNDESSSSSVHVEAAWQLMADTRARHAVTDPNDAYLTVSA